MSRILAYEALPKGIQVEGPVAPSSMGGSDDQGERGRLPGESEAKVGRFVDVGVFPMGIDVRTLREKKRVALVIQTGFVLKDDQRAARRTILGSASQTTLPRYEVDRG